MTLTSLRDRLPVDVTAIHTGLEQACLPGRFQVVPGPVEWILDVAHNPAAAAALADQLRNRACAGRTWAIMGLLADKDADGVIEALAGVVDQWHPVTLVGARGRPGADLAARLRSADLRTVAPHDDIVGACQVARAGASIGDRIVVLGSFHLVAPVLAAQPWIPDSSLPHLRETCSWTIA